MSPRPSHVTPVRQPATGKLSDPIFLFMLAAVLLALGSSFMLRAVVNGFAPPSARAAANDSPRNQLSHSVEDGQ